MSEQHENIESPPQEPLGSILERTRRSRHATLDEAAEATRISPRVLAALEADDFERLPAEIFTRGFIKLYAEYLGLDPEEILAHYINQENVDPDKPAARPYRSKVLDGEAMAHPPSIFKGSRRTLVIILLLALLLGLYLLGRLYKPKDHGAQDNTADNRDSAMVEKRSIPGAKATPPHAVPGEAENPAMERVKNLEPEATVQKDRGTPTPPSDSPTPPDQLKGNSTADPEKQSEELPKKVPAKPRPSASSKDGPAASPAATARFPEAPELAAKPQPVPSTTVSAGARPAEAVSSNPQPFQPVTVQVATTAVDGEEDLTTSPASPLVPRNYVLEGRFRESSWVHVEVDDQPVREYTSQADVTRVWRAADHLVLELGNGGAVDLTLNGKPFPMATKPGEAAIIRIPVATP